MPTEVRADVLVAFRACRLWQGASEDAIRALAEASSVREVTRGSLLATEGDAADRFGVVVSGRVRVFHSQADGRVITLETLESGQPFASVAALAGGRYPANVDAVTDGTVAWVPRQAIFEMLASQPDIAKAIIADLSSRVMSLTNVVQTLALDVPGRLARFLFQRSLAVGEATPEGLRVPLGTTKAELASSLGTVPETLSRALGRLRDEGVLEVRGNDIVVFDVGALARLGSGYEE
jgi:CRP/FNR family transcriptional regulator